MDGPLVRGNLSSFDSISETYATSDGKTNGCFRLMCFWDIFHLICLEKIILRREYQNFLKV